MPIDKKNKNLNRDYHNMPCNYPLVRTRFKLPKTLIKEYKTMTEAAEAIKGQVSGIS